MLRNLFIAILVLTSASAGANKTLTTKLLKKTWKVSAAFDKGTAKPAPLVNAAWSPWAPNTPKYLRLLRAAQSTSVRGNRTEILRRAYEASRQLDKGINVALDGSPRAIYGDAQRIVLEP